MNNTKHVIYQDNYIYLVTSCKKIHYMEKNKNDPLQSNPVGSY